ncbi:protein POLLEN DEFECTIVE IN GUIDANCE 1-like isoform X2 [Abrus precatorius]|uniref:Protein POLLEN DEFECTIVE IN GUIDANCE 1-like isoform X2 n=1 Tax=Abrus precatorius TaxID=3816 RepID=A0A8B8JMP0_ABRPR|nr:protein POLLEN DEFECTIVE IN GUIDANCE 1-like isoform X2 [Abrus precatorius]
MALRNGGRKLSFEVLSRSVSPEDESDPSQANRKKRKHRASKKKKKLLDRADSIDPLHSKTDAPFENGLACNGFELDAHRCFAVGGSVVVCEEVREASVCDVAEAREDGTDIPTSVRGGIEGFNFGELRQRNVNCGSSEDLVAPVTRDESAIGKDDGEVKVSPVEKPTNEPDRNVVTKLETVESLDWKRIMAEDPNCVFSVEKSPVRYFLEEMYNGNSLRSTTILGNEKERERVYDTIFRLPWRCELLIDVGFFVCFDSFLSLLTIMPTRIMMTIWRLLKTRQFKRLSTVEYSDFGCFLIMCCGVVLLQRTDISLIYHMIRGQGTIKLYVVYNVLEIFDKLCQSFNGDVLQTLFLSAEGLASCPPESMRFWIWRFVSDQALAVAASIAHSFILLAQAITLSTCIVAHNNALLALLVSNNFAEIKSNVFKRYSRDNVHSLVYFDSVERFHISAFILFVLAQNILEAEGPWFESFLNNILLVYVCEMIIDIIKHSFIAKFNDIKPITYSEFLEDLCKQTLNMQTEGAKKNLTFVPLAPACVVIRVLTPVYSANLPHNPLPWRIFWILLFSAMTYVMLTSLKVLIGMGLQKHATWYVDRCRRRKHHLHAD